MWSNEHCMIAGLVLALVLEYDRGRDLCFWSTQPRIKDP